MRTLEARSYVASEKGALVKPSGLVPVATSKLVQTLSLLLASSRISGLVKKESAIRYAVAISLVLVSQQ